MGSVSMLQAAQCHSEQWFQINWTDCYRQVRSLQNRIVKSIRNGAWRKAKRLCYLLVHSFAARCLAVKRVTDNKGKKTAGIDGIVWITPGQKMRAIEAIAHWKGYQPKALKRVRIPKKDKNQTRPLSIPTMEDRARQALHTLALQPIAETLGDTNSYGFRNKRRCADAIDQIFKTLRLKGSSQWILEGDIKGFFDNIDFDWLLKNIPMNKKVLRAWLHSGFLEEGKTQPTTTGVPQGGIISPVIGNMVLDGLEASICAYPRYKRNHGINFIRYADDFIVTAKSRRVLVEEIIPKINAFLSPRGVQLSEQKTKVTHISEGFDFLGQTIRKFPRKHQQLGKIQIEPSKKSIQSIKDKIKTICRSSGQLTQAQLIDRLNPVLRGWANYHRHVICGKRFHQIDSFVWFRLMRWGKHRHPEKTGYWIAKRYFSKSTSSAWNFKDKATGKRLIKLSADIQTFRHIKIQGDANPFDAEWNGYFHNREVMLKMKSANTFIGRVFKQQGGLCPLCKQLLQTEDKQHLHYRDGDKTHKRISNVVLLHKNCKSCFNHIKGKHVYGASTRDVSHA
ncbi:MAG: group II intron reverse transcriptase/maturase [Desulfobacterales bacterium]